MAPPNLVDFPKMWEMTISKPTFLPSKPCTTHFECLESGPNDSTRVRRLTGILRRARVEIFFDWAPRIQNCEKNGYGAVNQNIQTFMSNLGYL